MIYFLYLKESEQGLKYIGSTTRDPLKYRGSGKYWVRHLKKYPKSVIKTTVLFSSEDIIEFRKMCIYYSKMYDVVKSKEYANLIPESGIDSVLGRICTPETREKISIANMGRKPSLESIEKAKRSRKVRRGWHHSEETKKILSSMRIGKTLSKSTIEKMIKKTKGGKLPKNYKKVYQYDMRGIFIKEWDSIQEPSKLLNCDINNVVNGRHMTAGGFLWKKEFYDSLEPHIKESPLLKKIYQFTINNEFIKEWSSQKEIYQKLGFKRTSILNAVCGLNRTSHGFKWSYNKCHTEKTKLEKESRKNI